MTEYFVLHAVGAIFSPEKLPPLEFQWSSTAVSTYLANVPLHVHLALGRWTSDEHRLFLKGLELHGKGWKQIATLIQTRTVVQIRWVAADFFTGGHRMQGALGCLDCQ